MEIHFKEKLIIFTILAVFPLLASCGPLKYKPVDAKEVSPDPKERVRKNIEEGRGFRIMGGVNRGGKFDFASSNPLWRATLDVIDFMPLATANYSGGIVITDWYSDNDPNESKNLLDDPKFKNQLIKGRKLLDDWLVNEGTKLIAER